MRAVRLPNGNLLIAAEAEPLDAADAADRLHEIRPDDPQYGRWLAFAEEGEDPRSQQGG